MELCYFTPNIRYVPENIMPAWRFELEGGGAELFIDAQTGELLDQEEIVSIPF